MTDLEAVRAIEQVKYRYLRAFDTKDWAEFESCLVPEATADYAGLAFPDRDALLAYMRRHVVEGVISVHHCHHPEIDVAADGRTATGRWALNDLVIVPAMRYRLEGASIYSDDYVLTDRGWRIAHTGYVRLYEATMSLDDVPSWRLSGAD